MNLLIRGYKIIALFPFISSRSNRLDLFKSILHFAVITLATQGHISHALTNPFLKIEFSESQGTLSLTAAFKNTPESACVRVKEVQEKKYKTVFKKD